MLVSDLLSEVEDKHVMIVLPASCECSSADKTEMAAQCPLYYTLHRQKGQRKQALEKRSLAREA